MGFLRKLSQQCYVALAAIVVALAGQPTSAQAADTVNLYSFRQPFLIQPFLDAFTASSGIDVKVVYADKGLIERLKAEGLNSPADAILTVDIGRVQELVENDLAAPVRSDLLQQRVPANLRDPEGRWFALTMRARVVYASKERVQPGALPRYEDLADPKWRGRICTRSGKHVYNVALIAAMIAHKGAAKTEKWLKGVKANLARKPQGNDRAQIRAVAEGVCDLAIGNSYYLGKMLTDPDDKAAAEAVFTIFPSLGDHGTHVNISAAAVTKSAKNKKAAIALIEYLASPAAQGLFAAQNFEYPVVDGVPLDPMVRSFGTLKPDPLSLLSVAENREAAIRLVDKVGFDL